MNLTGLGTIQTIPVCPRCRNAYIIKGDGSISMVYVTHGSLSFDKSALIFVLHTMFGLIIDSTKL